MFPVRPFISNFDVCQRNIVSDLDVSKWFRRKFQFSVTILPAFPALLFNLSPGPFVLLWRLFSNYYLVYDLWWSLYLIDTLAPFVIQPITCQLYIVPGAALPWIIIESPLLNNRRLL